jgi:hypothetical protein
MIVKPIQCGEKSRQNQRAASSGARSLLHPVTMNGSNPAEPVLGRSWILLEIQATTKEQREKE